MSNAAATGSSSPSSLATQAGTVTSLDGRYKVQTETIIWNHKHFGDVIQRDVVDNTTGKLQDQVIWSRNKNFVVTVLIAPDETGKDAIWVKREFKLGVMNYVLTSAAGGIKKDEAARATASRELWEEFGVIPVDIEQIGDSLQESPDKIANASQVLFLARGISQTKTDREEGEIQKFPLTKEGVTTLLNSMTVVLHKLAIYEALRVSGKLALLV